MEILKLSLFYFQTLVELISLAESDDDGKAAANYLTKSQKDEKITSLRNERNSWKQSSLQAAANQILDSDMTEVLLAIFCYFLYILNTLDSFRKAPL